MLLICYVGSIIQLIFANTLLEGNIAFFLTIGNVAFEIGVVQRLVVSNYPEPITAEEFYWLSLTW